MTFMNELISAMQNLFLIDTPVSNPVSSSIMDPLKSHPSISLQDYLNLTSTCVSLGANRFEYLPKRIDFLNDLVKKVIRRDHHWTIAWAFDNSEKMAFIHRLFPEKLYAAPLSIRCSGETAIDYVALNSILQKFPNTEKLLLPMSKGANNEHFVSCVNRCKKLVALTVPHDISAVNYLHIDWGKSIKRLTISKDVSREGVKKIFDSCQQIEVLFFESTNNLDISFFNKVDFPRSLRSLSFTETRITGRGLIKIAQKCSKLTGLSLRLCPNITPEKISAAGFALGVKIVFEACLKVVYPKRFRYQTGLGYV